MENINAKSDQALDALSSAVVRLLLQQGITYPRIKEEFQLKYLTEAHAMEGENVTTSALARRTGLNWRVISRYLKDHRENGGSSEQAASQPLNIESIVLDVWGSDPDYMDGDAPAELTIYGPKPSFQTLCHRSGAGSISYRPILDALVEAQAAIVVDNKIRRLSKEFIGKGATLFTSAADAISRLTNTCQNNIESRTFGAMPEMFQQEIWSNEFSEHALDAVRSVSRAFLHETKAQAISRLESLEEQGKGETLAGIGLYYFEGTSK